MAAFGSLPRDNLPLPAAGALGIELKVEGLT